MSKLTELLDLASQGKLDEIDTLAALAQEFTVDCIIQDPFWAGVTRDCYLTDAGYVPISDYHPTRNNAQAVDLMLKAELSPVISNGQIYFIGFRGLPYFPKEDFAKAVTIAFILANQGENND